MARANVLASELVTSLETGEFLNYVDGQLRASNAVFGGNGNGLITSLDPTRDSDNIVDIAPSRPGLDSPRDIAVRETFANGRLFTEVKKSDQKAGKMHVLMEYDERYGAATGTHPLGYLARLTVAMALFASEETKTDTRLVATGNGQELFEFDDQPHDATWAFTQLDKNIAKGRGKEKSKKSPLAEGLGHVKYEGLNSESDVCLVISDFIDGAKYSHGRLSEFDWQEPLSELATALDDRLYVVRLTTPAHTQLPYRAHYQLGSKNINVDMDEYKRMATAYQLKGQEKAARIAECLSGIRSVDLSSTDSVPFITAADFIFGEPAE